MSYYDPRQQPPQSIYGQEPATAYPVDEDGDRIYTEEDYAVPADGDAFYPDEEVEPALYADPFAAQQPFSYAGSYDTLAVTDDDWEGEENMEDELADELLTQEEQEELRRSNWRLMAGLADFGAVILGTAVILVLITLLVSLMNWLINDISQTFTLLQMPF